jgi:branched-chain amino acid transport system substrate-binding protein
MAVIALHGVPHDEAYLASLADSLAAGTPPIRIEVFNPSTSPEDEWSDALATAEAIAHLEGLVGVVGHRDSRSTLVVAPIYQRAGVPLIVPNATSSAIGELGPSVFSLVPDDREQGALLARAAVEGLGARTITIFHVADEYGAGIRGGVIAAGPGSIEILDVVEYGLERAGCPEAFQPFVDASLLKGTPDVVVLASRAGDGACLARLFSERAPDVRFLAADGVEANQAFLDVAGPAADQVWFVRFWTEEGNPAVRDLSRRYQAQASGPMDPGTPLRLDGVDLLVEAVRQVGGSPAAVTRWIEGLGVDHPAYQGYTGEISFAPEAPRLMVLTDKDGTPVPWSPR